MKSRIARCSNESQGRRLFSRGLIYLFLFFLAFYPAHADDGPSDSLQVTLTDCIKTAIANYYSLRIASERIRTAESDKTAAYAPILPNVNLNTGYTRGISVSSGSGYGVVDTKQTAVNYSQTYMDGGQTRLAVEKADWGLKSTREDYTVTRQDLIFNVSNAFFDLIRAQAQTRFSVEDANRARRQLELVKARIAAGDAAEVDRYQLEVEVSKADLNIITATNTVKQKSNRLRNLMGLPAGGPLIASEELGPLGRKPTLQEAGTEALANRAELRRSEYALASSKTDRAIADLKNRPLFNLSGGYGQGFGDWNSPFYQWSATAGVSVLIFDSGLTTSRLRRAESQINIAREQYNQLRTDILLEVEQNYIALETALERIPANRTLLFSAKKNLEAAEAKYKAGVGTTLEIIQARVDYTNAELSLLQSQIDFLVARSALLKSMGKEIPED
jgi:outer membrane protein TolC